MRLTTYWFPPLYIPVNEAVTPNCRVRFRAHVHSPLKGHQNALRVFRFLLPVYCCEPTSVFRRLFLGVTIRLSLNSDTFCPLLNVMQDFWRTDIWVMTARRMISIRFEYPTSSYHSVVHEILDKLEPHRHRVGGNLLQPFLGRCSQDREQFELA